MTLEILDIKVLTFYVEPASAESFLLILVQATENLGMAMVYTLVTSAKDWLAERFSQDDGSDNAGDAEAAKDDVCVLFHLFSFLLHTSSLVPFICLQIIVD